MINNLILSNLNLAKKIAWQKKFKIKQVYWEDLESAAYFGLVQAAHTYNSNKNVKFATFAYYRINGAIKDYLNETFFNSVTFDNNLDLQESKNHTFYNELKNFFPKKIMDIFDSHFCQGESLKKIGRRYNISAMTVSRLISKYRKKAIKYFSS